MPVTMEAPPIRVKKTGITARLGLGSGRSGWPVGGRSLDGLHGIDLQTTSFALACRHRLPNIPPARQFRPNPWRLSNSTGLRKSFGDTHVLRDRPDTRRRRDAGDRRRLGLRKVHLVAPGRRAGDPHFRPDHLDGRDVTDADPADRDIAMVFQNYALYPHMTRLRQYGLRAAHPPSAQHRHRQRVDEAAAMLGLTELLGRKPRQLSGGQRQRVAMGRAIVREPKVFLFDEPLSNLDAKLRVQMRVEIGLHADWAQPVSMSRMTRSKP